MRHEHVHIQPPTHTHIRPADGNATKPMKTWHVHCVHCNKLPTRKATALPHLTFRLPRLSPRFASYTWRASFHLVFLVFRYAIFFARPDTFFTYSVVDILRDWRQPRGVNKWKWNCRHFVGRPLQMRQCVCLLPFCVLIMIGIELAVRCSLFAVRCSLQHSQLIYRFPSGNFQIVATVQCHMPLRRVPTNIMANSPNRTAHAHLLPHCDCHIFNYNIQIFINIFYSFCCCANTVFTS